MRGHARKFCDQYVEVMEEHIRTSVNSTMQSANRENCSRRKTDHVQIKENPNEKVILNIIDLNSVIMFQETGTLRCIHAILLTKETLL